VKLFVSFFPASPGLATVGIRSVFLTGLWLL